MRPYSLGKKERIRKNYEFQRVYGQGKKVVSRYFVIYWIESEAPIRRLGVSASRKIGKAVQRNRAKRLAREVFRRNKYCLSPGIDLIMVTRRGLDQQSYTTIEPLFTNALKRIERSREKSSHPGAISFSVGAERKS
jgi:ribonuclease P protein component